MTGYPPQSSKPKWHSRSWWTAAGVISAVIIGLLAIVLTPRGTSGPEAQNPQDPASQTPITQPAPSITPTVQPSTVAKPAQNPAPDAAPTTLFMRDLSSDDFITTPYASSLDPQTINGNSYPSSYSFEFENCGNCRQDTVFNVPNNYTKFSGTFGLTDKSRHDSVIDGVEYFAVYSSTNALLFGPQRVEFPNSVPFNISIAGIHRLKIQVTGGDNYEYACFCNAAFSG
jgi:hypothetical protein